MPDAKLTGGMFQFDPYNPIYMNVLVYSGSSLNWNTQTSEKQTFLIDPTPDSVGVRGIC